MADERDEVRSRIDIVDLIGREIQLKKAGKTWKGLCPFHPDKNPSFTVSQETGRYKCWSCGESGDIFTWEMKRRNVDFVEALQTLAHQAGIDLQSRSAVPPSQRLQQHAAMDEALSFFREQFLKSTSAREYCEARGIDAETLSKWEIGYAPDVGEALAVHLKKKGFQLAECKSLFLVDEDARGGYYDKFRGRLMIPIRDEKGTLVAFGGRILGDGHPKYINSGDTPLYRKSRVLYGMNHARDQISKLRQAVLVEGYLDVIACHRAGVTQAVASLGTALAEEQAKLLSRWCDEVVILYDSDEAGKKAAERGVEVLKPEGLKVRVALMPTGDDPDTLLRRDGPASVQDSVKAALSPVEYRLRLLSREHTYEEEAFWNEVAQILAGASNQAEIDRHIAEIAPFYPWQRNLAKAADMLRKQVFAIRGKVRHHQKPVVATEHYSLKSTLSSPEIVLLRAVLSEHHRQNAWQFATAGDLFESALGERLSRVLIETFPNQPPVGPLSEWLHKIEEEQLRQTLSDLTLDFRAENLSEDKLIDSVKRLSDLREARKREVLKRSGADRAEIFAMLKSKKPDTRAPKKQKDSLF